MTSLDACAPLARPRPRGCPAIAGDGRRRPPSFGRSRVSDAEVGRSRHCAAEGSRRVTPDRGQHCSSMPWELARASGSSTWPVASERRREPRWTACSPSAASSASTTAMRPLPSPVAAAPRGQTSDAADALALPITAAEFDAVICDQEAAGHRIPIAPSRDARSLAARRNPRNSLLTRRVAPWWAGRTSGPHSRPRSPSAIRTRFATSSAAPGSRSGQSIMPLCLGAGRICGRGRARSQDSRRFPDPYLEATFRVREAFIQRVVDDLEGHRLARGHRIPLCGHILSAIVSGG